MVPLGDVDAHWCGVSPQRCMTRGSGVCRIVAVKHVGLCLDQRILQAASIYRYSLQRIGDSDGRDVRARCRAGPSLPVHLVGDGLSPRGFDGATAEGARTGSAVQAKANGVASSSGDETPAVVLFEHWPKLGVGRAGRGLGEAFEFCRKQGLGFLLSVEEIQVTPIVVSDKTQTAILDELARGAKSTSRSPVNG